MIFCFYYIYNQFLFLLHLKQNSVSITFIINFYFYYIYSQFLFLLQSLINFCFY